MAAEKSTHFDYVDVDSGKLYVNVPSSQKVNPNWFRIEPAAREHAVEVNGKWVYQYGNPYPGPTWDTRKDARRAHYKVDGDGHLYVYRNLNGQPVRFKNGDIVTVEHGQRLGNLYEPKEANSEEDSGPLSPWQTFRQRYRALTTPYKVLTALAITLGVGMVVLSLLPAAMLKTLFLGWLAPMAPFIGLVGSLLVVVPALLHVIHIAMQKSAPNELGARWRQLNPFVRFAIAAVITLSVSAILVALFSPVFGSSVAAFFNSPAMGGLSVKGLFGFFGGFAALAGIAAVPFHFWWNSSEEKSLQNVFSTQSENMPKRARYAALAAVVLPLALLPLLLATLPKAILSSTIAGVSLGGVALPILLTAVSVISLTAFFGYMLFHSSEPKADPFVEDGHKAVGMPEGRELDSSNTNSPAPKVESGSFSLLRCLAECCGGSEPESGVGSKPSALSPHDNVRYTGR